MATDNGSYAVAGTSNGRYLLAKADSSGNVLLWKTFQTGETNCAVQTSDGGYALAGSGEVNFIKTNSEGNVEWSKNFMNGNMTYTISSIAKTGDDGYILTGLVPSGHNPGLDWTVKTDPEGNIIWSKTFGSWSTVTTEVIEVEGGYILGANLNIYKLDENGEIVWSRHSGIIYSIVSTADGGYLMVVSGDSGTQKVVKTDSEGYNQWVKTYAVESAVDSDVGEAVQTEDGGFIMCGTTYPAWEAVGWVFKTDSSGNLKWNSTSTPIIGYNSRISYIAEVGNGEYVFTGSVGPVMDLNANTSLWLVKMASSIPTAVNTLISESVNNSGSEPTQTQASTTVGADDELAAIPPFIVAVIVSVVIFASVLSALLYKRSYLSRGSLPN